MPRSDRVKALRIAVVCLAVWSDSKSRMEGRSKLKIGDPWGRKVKGQGNKVKSKKFRSQAHSWCRDLTNEFINIGLKCQTLRYTKSLRKFEDLA